MSLPDGIQKNEKLPNINRFYGFVSRDAGNRFRRFVSENHMAPPGIADSSSFLPGDDDQILNPPVSGIPPHGLYQPLCRYLGLIVSLIVL